MWRELQMGNKRIGPMRRIAKKQINKEIRKQERHERRTLDIEEKREIKNNVLKKMRTRAAIFGAVGVLGIGAFALYNVNKDNIKELGEGTKVETEMENDTNPRDEFVKGLTVEIPEGIIDEVKTEVFHEVRELKTPEDILNYTKQIYIDKYNENNNFIMEDSIKKYILVNLIQKNYQCIIKMDRKGESHENKQRENF